MKENDITKWGPNDDLGRQIKRVPYPSPSADLTRRIMAPLRPVQPGLVRRLVSWAKEPLTIRLSPAVVTVVVILLMLPVAYVAYHVHDNPAMPAQGTSGVRTVPVVFHYKDKAARSVAVIGSFNNWDPKGHALAWQPELERWALQIHLAPGRHDYVFFVNGEKVAPDPNADLIQKDDFGNRNSVLFIKGKNDLRI